MARQREKQTEQKAFRTPIITDRARTEATTLPPSHRDNIATDVERLNTGHHVGSRMLATFCQESQLHCGSECSKTSLSSCDARWVEELATLYFSGCGGLSPLVYAPKAVCVCVSENKKHNIQSSFQYRKHLPNFTCFQGCFESAGSL